MSSMCCSLRARAGMIPAYSARILAGSFGCSFFIGSPFLVIKFLKKKIMAVREA